MKQIIITGPSMRQQYQHFRGAPLYSLVFFLVHIVHTNITSHDLVHSCMQNVPYSLHVHTPSKCAQISFLYRARINYRLLLHYCLLQQIAKMITFARV